MENKKEEDEREALNKRLISNLDQLNNEMQKLVKQSEKTNNIRILAVSKQSPISDIVAAYNAGQRHFAEDQVNELAYKQMKLEKTHEDIQWHFIGQV